METLTLHEFIDVNRDALISRCRVKVAERSSPPPTELEIDHESPLFLDQLIVELRDGPSQTADINEGAVRHGRDLLLQKFTISQVVHDYGDVCQSITDMAVETNAPISTDEFRTLNRCLDDAIAGAVTEYSRAEDVTREGDAQELRNLTNTAITAFDVLQAGRVGVAGSTGAVLRRSLIAIRALVDRALAAPDKTLTHKLH